MAGPCETEVSAPFRTSPVSTPRPERAFVDMNPPKNQSAPVPCGVCRFVHGGANVLCALKLQGCVAHDLLPCIVAVQCSSCSGVMTLRSVQVSGGVRGGGVVGPRMEGGAGGAQGGQGVNSTPLLRSHMCGPPGGHAPRAQLPVVSPPPGGIVQRRFLRPSWSARRQRRRPAPCGGRERRACRRRAPQGSSASAAGHAAPALWRM